MDGWMDGWMISLVVMEMLILPIPTLLGMPSIAVMKNNEKYLYEIRDVVLVCFYLNWVQIHPSIGTILCTERRCCRSSFLGYWAQSLTGRHSDTVYQHAGTHFADLGQMTG